LAACHIVELYSGTVVIRLSIPHRTVFFKVSFNNGIREWATLLR